MGPAVSLASPDLVVLAARVSLALVGPVGPAVSLVSPVAPVVLQARSSTPAASSRRRRRRRAQLPAVARATTPRRSRRSPTRASSDLVATRPLGRPVSSSSRLRVLLLPLRPSSSSDSSGPVAVQAGSRPVAVAPVAVQAGPRPVAVAPVAVQADPRPASRRTSSAVLLEASLLRRRFRSAQLHALAARDPGTHQYRGLFISTHPTYREILSAEV